MFFVFRDSYVLCIYVMNILCTFIIFIYGYVTVFSRFRYLSFFLLSFNLTLWSAGPAKSTIWQVSFFFFFLTIIRPDHMAKIRWSVCISKSQRSLYVSFSRMGCAYTICSYGQISISCTIPCRSPCPSSHVLSYTLSILVCCIHLRDWSFNLYHHITYICCFVASYLFLLWYNWFL